MTRQTSANSLPTLRRRSGRSPALWLLTALSAVALPAALSAAPHPAPTPEPDAVLPVETRDAGVYGRVLDQVEPLAAVRVYAYQLADFSLERVVTDEAGAFRFPELPAGLYKIIAHKSGFVPAVVMLTRPRKDSSQFLELELAAELSEPTDEEDFWSVRDRIPPDVLRDITTPGGPGLRLAASRFGHGTERPTLDHRFATEMEAMTGIEQLPSVGEAMLTGGQLGFEGSLGGLRLGLSGDYWRLAPSSGSALESETEVDGLARQLALEVEGESSQLLVSTLTQRLNGTGDEPIDFEVHRLSWGKDLDRSRAYVAAEYTSQSNFYADAPLAPVEVPRSSTAWEVEGSYTLEASERSSFQGGLRYRDRAVGLSPASYFPDGEGPLVADALHDERMDLYGRSGFRVRPAVLVEYGLYTTLRDGSLSLTPHGGVVLQVGDDWQASALASGKVSPGEPQGPQDFIPAFYRASTPCTQGEESCYKISLSRTDRSGESALSMGAVHREIGETLRLFFDDDFFNHVESLYLVRGDELPEVQFGVSRQVSPKILARLESNAGEGGGGIFYATDQARYENSVRFLVTSIDTRFQETETGLFVSFHHLEQELDPVRGALQVVDSGPENGSTRSELQRLQLMLTQDLDILFDLAADWALKLNMELSRGSVLFGTGSADADELRRKILGGFAVKF